jgi:hypothetical protein
MFVDDVQTTLGFSPYAMVAFRQKYFSLAALPFVAKYFRTMRSATG